MLITNPFISPISFGPCFCECFLLCFICLFYFFVCLTHEKLEVTFFFFFLDAYFFKKSTSVIPTLASTTPRVLTSSAISCVPVDLVILENSVILILMTVRINHVSTMAHVTTCSITTPAHVQTVTGASTAKRI